MRPFYWIILIVVEVWLTSLLAFDAVNLAKVPYRRAERSAALTAVSEAPSDATRAALQEEFRRVGRHVQSRQYTKAALIFGAFIVLDVFCFYGWKHFAKKPVSA